MEWEEGGGGRETKARIRRQKQQQVMYSVAHPSSHSLRVQFVFSGRSGGAYSLCRK